METKQPKLFSYFKYEEKKFKLGLSRFVKDKDIWQIRCLPGRLCFLKLNNISFPNGCFSTCPSCSENKTWILKKTKQIIEKDILTYITRNKPHLTLPTYCAWDYILMPEAPTLDDMMDTFQSTEEIDKLMEKLLHLLVELHSVGIVHRDLKPSNLVFYNGELRFIDFGVSRYSTFSPVAADDLSTYSKNMVPRLVSMATFPFACPYQLKDIALGKTSASFPHLDLQRDTWGWGMVWLYCLRGGRCLYYETEEERLVHVKWAKSVLYRYATRIDLTKENTDEFFNSFHQATAHPSSNCIKDRLNIQTRNLLSKALTWNIENRPTPENWLHPFELLHQKIQNVNEKTQKKVFLGLLLFSIKYHFER